MRHPLALFIGRRYAGAKRSNHFISFISTFSMIGLTLGVLVLITVMSVMNGFDRELRERILGMVPHATLESWESMEDWQATIAEIKRDPSVAGAAPYIHAQAMATSRGHVQGVFINGVDPQRETEVSIVENHFVSGDLETLEAGEFRILLGDILASYLRVRPGDQVTLILPEATLSPAGVYPRLKRFTVSGIFSVGAELDSTLAIVHIEDAARLRRMGSAVDGIRLRFHDLFQARAEVRRLADGLGPGYRASDWTHTHGNLFQAIKMEKTLVGLLLGFIVAVASFNIISTLVMVVTEKKADIAIMRTMGASRAMILRIFMIQGAIIGVVGTFWGGVLGCLLAVTISDLVAAVEKLFDIQFLGSDVYFISYLPSQLLFSDVALICGATLTLSLLATIYPAWKASRVDPAEALRYE